MPTEEPVEKRLAALEQEVNQLRQRVEQVQRSADWRQRVCGSLKTMPEFDEVLRLGSEFRRSDREEA